jgi:hypothetical protein
MEQRIIKFRAWDGEKMIYSNNENNLLAAFFDELFKSDILMQFTGLLDKNGKEVYEGDIIHRHLGVFWKVVFKNSKWIAEPPKPESGLYLDASQFIEAEVIGNILETPELIK